MTDDRMSDVAPATGPQFYKTMSHRASFGELWRDARSPAVLILWVTKLLRIPIAGILNDVPVAAFAPFEIAFDDLPDQAAGHLRAMQAELSGAGYSAPPVVAFVVKDAINNCTAYTCVLIADDRQSIARLTARLTAARTLRNPRRIVEIISALSTGQMLCSTNSHCYQDAPKDVRLNPAVRAKPLVVAERHKAALREQPASVIAIPNALAAVTLAERYHGSIISDGLARGLYRTLNKNETEQAERLETVRTEAVEQQSADPEVLVEIQKLQDKKSNWLGGVFTLLLTLALFAVTSRNVFDDPATIGLLILVLFVHEAGHFIAMRVFGYRNVQMFFIPLFGAAVKGEHYNVPGWKKAVVALMGPVPGIAIGGIIGVLGLILHHTILLKAALLALLLNGANLLPILPFDGGRVAHALIFARHWLLDTAFRILAGGTLIFLSFKLHDRVLAPLGVVMLLGIPAAYRTARLTREFRRTGLPPAPPDSQAIPPDVANVLIERVKGDLSVMKLPNAAIARRVLDTYEALNARPPGWLGSIALGGLHLGSFVAAVVLALAVAIGLNPGFASMLRSALSVPTQAVSLDQIAFRSGPPAVPTSAPATTSRSVIRRDPLVLANFKSASIARSAFDQLSPMLRAGDRIELFGQTLLVAYALGDTAARTRWISALEHSSDDVFAHKQGSFLLLAVCPDEADATRLADRFTDFNALSQDYEMPLPWVADQATPTSLSAQENNARRTFARLLNAGHLEPDAPPTPEETDLRKQISESVRIGDDEAAKRLRAKMRQHYLDRKKAAEEAIAADPNSDQVVVQAYRVYSAASPDLLVDETDDLDESPSPATTQAAADAYKRSNEARKSLIERLGPRLGVKARQAVSETDSASFLAQFDFARAFATREGLTVRVNLYGLRDPLNELPVIARWLSASGTRMLRYNFGTGKQSDSPNLNGLEDLGN